jgi:DNA-binding FadR family transcriptional regulator
MAAPVPTELADGHLVQPVQRFSMREQLAHELQRLIMTGNFPIGTPLPSEAQIGQTFRCSRSVVREALRDVEQIGLVERAYNGRELIVQPPSLDRVSHAMRLYMEMQGITMHELFECLELLDPIASRLAAERADAGLVAALTDMNDESLLTVENLPETEVQFHLRLTEASHNRLFVAAWKPIFDAFGVVVAGVAPMMGRTMVTGSQRAHAEVIRAIAAGDPGGAEAWSRRHCAAFRRELNRGGRSPNDPVRPRTGLATRSR